MWHIYSVHLFFLKKWAR